MDECIYLCIDVWMNGFVDVCMDGWMDGQMDVGAIVIVWKMDGYMDELIN